jgi:ABC-type uncharacterized transport system auxiliary subunit
MSSLVTAFLSPAKKLPVPELTARSHCLRGRAGELVTLAGSIGAEKTRAVSVRALSPELSGPLPGHRWQLARTLRSLLVLVAVLLLSTSCIHGKLPAREFYQLHLPEPTDSIAAAEHDAMAAPRLPSGGIAIVPYVTPGVYGDGNIVFRIDENSYGTYPNREWALPIATMLGMITEDVFKERPLTRDPVVFNPPSPHSYTYVWRGMVRELEEVDRGSHVYAAVRLDARLVRARDDSVLWSGNARLERLVPDATMPAIVGMLSQLSAEVIVQLQESARASVFGSAASAVRPPLRDSTARR